MFFGKLEQMVFGTWQVKCPWLFVSLRASFISTYTLFLFLLFWVKGDCVKGQKGNGDVEEDDVSLVLCPATVSHFSFWLPSHTVSSQWHRLWEETPRVQNNIT